MAPSLSLETTELRTKRYFVFIDSPAVRTLARRHAHGFEFAFEFAKRLVSSYRIYSISSTNSGPGSESGMTLCLLTMCLRQLSFLGNDLPPCLE